LSFRQSLSLSLSLSKEREREREREREKNDSGKTRRDELIYPTHLLVRIDVYMTFDALLTHISPAVA
jgi:hypothetical protein